jgi:hypothetical protein
MGFNLINQIAHTEIIYKSKFAMNRIDHEMQKRKKNMGLVASSFTKKGNLKFLSYEATAIFKFSIGQCSRVAKDI